MQKKGADNPVPFIPITRTRLSLPQRLSRRDTVTLLVAAREVA